MEEMNLKEREMIAQYGEAPTLDLSKIKNISANKEKGNDVQIIESKVKEFSFRFIKDDSWKGLKPINTNEISEGKCINKQ